ncbi:MAG: hypothetical protein LBQ19_03305 [Synergistaceae bacterium]|jgi:hypothetical protein|nr:hypothetical protein [Synergistaceae bacterium]
MPKGKDNLPDNKEEQDHLSRALALAPLLTVFLQFLELLLKIIGVIR